MGYLQFMLERKIPVARVNGAAGMRLSRAAFGVMIKFSDFTDTIQNLVDEIDLLWDELNEDGERDLKIREALKTVPNFDNILKRWESASKMRTWISDKKKNLVNRITREVESEYIKKKQEKKDEPAAEEKKEEKANEEEKKEESSEPIKVDDIEIIDTSSTKPVAEEAPATEEPSKDEKGLTVEDKENIQKLSDDKYEAELESIFQKIVEKADFLIKL
jgi:hypothetical protein